MKILTLEFKNINSLYGEWKIDFTDEHYVQNHNIFIIHGPTGSGKTSVLDAITLALYARTPRQEKINKGVGGNEVMTRETASCYSRIKYQCKNGVFISEWSQSRAYNRIDGTLQQPEYKITDENGNLVEEGKVAQKKDKNTLEEATIKLASLEFKQFCRSIMLAQGEFNRFLDSEDAERSAILEKLNGAERYKKIAQNIAARAKEERQKRDLLKSTHDEATKNVLTLEEKEKLSQENVQLTEQRKKLHDQLDEINKDIQWYDDLETRSDEIKKALENKTECENQSKEFKEDKIRLERAENAQKCRTEYEMVNSKRNELKKVQDDSTLVLSELEKAKKDYDAAVAESSKITKLVKETEDKIEKETPVWEKVKKLDADISAQSKTVQQVKERVDAAQERETNIENEIKDVQSKIKECKETIEKYNLVIQSHPADESISSKLSGLEQRIELYQSESKTLDAECKTLDEENKNLAFAINAEKENLQTIEELQAYIKDNSADKTLLEVLPKAQSLYDGIKNTSDALEETKRTLAQKKNDEASLVKEKDLNDNVLKNIEEEIAKFSLDNMGFIAGQLERLLKPGDKCPVCGGEFHGASCPTNEDGEKNLDDVTSKLKSLNDDRDVLRAKLASINANLTAYREQIKLAENEITKKEESQKKDLDSVSKILEPWNVEVNSDTLQNVLDDLKKRSETFCEKEDKLKKLNEDCSSAKSNLAVLQSKVDSLKESVGAKEKRLSLSRNEIQNIISAWDLTFDDDNAKNIIDTLSARAAEWNKAKDAIKENEGHLNSNTLLLNEKETQKNSAKKDCEKEETVYSHSKEILAQREDERKNLFADKDVSAEESRMRKSLQELRKESERFASDAQEKNTVKTSLVTEYEGLQKNIESDKAELLDKTKAFENAIQVHGFIDEADFVSSLISNDEIKTLSEKRQKIELDLESSRSAYEKAKKSYDQFAATKRDGMLSKDDCLSQSDTLSNNIDELSQNIGAINNKLKSSEDSGDYVKQLEEELQKQNSVCAKWEQMREWIGVQDGSTFSIFVQSLTFKHLLAISNVYLQKMKKRYELLPSEGLSFKLKDSNFAEPRSITNISGGERFLVSLSLALGIAKFASKNIKVDSLFLDEGFGTLSGDELNNVLDTLKEMQTQGKMLGIISHLPAVYDALPQRIEVIPVPGGHSILKGDGIEHVGARTR